MEAYPKHGPLHEALDGKNSRERNVHRIVHCGRREAGPAGAPAGDEDAAGDDDGEHRELKGFRIEEGKEEKAGGEGRRDVPTTAVSTFIARTRMIASRGSRSAQHKPLLGGVPLDELLQRLRPVPLMQRPLVVMMNSRRLPAATAAAVWCC